MAAEARRGLAWRQEYGRGGTLVGVARARDISNKKDLSPSTVRRMVSYFARHEVDKQGQGFSPGEQGYPSAGRIAWALWGGDAGQSWANAKSKQLEGTESMQILRIENKAAKVKLNEQVDKLSMDRLNEEIAKVFGAKAAAEGKNFGEIMNCANNAVDTLDIEIHSPGGSILDGYTLYNSILDLRGRGVYVTANITLAASMASVIAMAADKIVMRKGARMMIHEASASTYGNAKDHADRAQLLESFSDEIAGIYAGRTKQGKEIIREMMKKETWMDAKTAVELGFADEEFDTPKKAEAMSNLLARLTNPSDAEAKERIDALENQIQAHDSIVSDFQAKLDLAENALQEATTELTAIRAEVQTKCDEITNLQGSIQAKDEQIAEMTACISRLEAEAKETQEKIGNKAAELLASAGHVAPVNLTDDAGETNTKLISRKDFNALTPHERLQFVKAGGKIK